MRIHGIHLQGLRAPAGVRRLEFAGGYTVVTGAREDLAALMRLCQSLLDPSQGLRARDWVADGSETPPRAGLAFSFGQRAYRLIADVDQERVVLGRYDANSQRYQRVSVDPGQIGEHLRGVGLPTADVLRALHYCAGEEQRGAPRVPGTSATGAAPTPVAGARQDESMRERGRLEEELGRARSAERERLELEPRVEALRTAREHVVSLERSYKQVRDEVEQRAVLAECTEDLDDRLDRYRELVARRDSERAGIEHSRQALLEDRARLRVVPVTQGSWMWLGVALGAAGALAGSLAHPGFYVAAVLGLGLALCGLLLGRRARRKLGHIEARLAALRVRERAIERKFESEGAPVRSLLLALELESPEGLASAAAEYRALCERMESLREDLDRAQEAFPEAAAEELRELEAQLAAARGVRAPAAIREQLARLPEVEAPTKPEIPDVDDPPTAVTDTLEGPFETRLRAAVQWTGRRREELEQLVAATLPLYIRPLTAGSYTDLRQDPDSGRLALANEAGAVANPRELDPGLCFLVDVGLRLALLEVLAPFSRIPFWLGPATPALEPVQRQALGKALGRVGQLVQVIQLATPDAAWSERARRVVEL